MFGRDGHHSVSVLFDGMAARNGGGHSAFLGNHMLTCLDTAVSFVATFLPLAQRLADCENTALGPSILSNLASSFAFVEYESRRDADDAYHDIHNKRIGRDRDEVLKIEVSSLPSSP
jgi:hypothetical protein